MSAPPRACAAIVTGLLCLAAPARAQEPPAVVPADERPATPRRQLRNHFLFAAQLGGAYRYAFRESLVSGHLSVHLGVADGYFGGGVRVDGDVGLTVPGLRFEALALGPAFHYQPHPLVRLNMGLSVGRLWAHRVTTSATLAPLTSIGVWVEPTVDLWRTAEVAVYAALRVGATDYLAEDVALEGALCIGLRLTPGARPLPD